MIKEGAINQAVESFYNTLIESSMFQQLHAFKDKVKIFGKENDVYEFLDALKQYFGKCSGCSSDNGFKLCDVRKCAKERKVTSCSECPDFNDCDLLLDRF